MISYIVIIYPTAKHATSVILQCHHNVRAILATIRQTVHIIKYVSQPYQFATSSQSSISHIGRYVSLLHQLKMLDDTLVCHVNQSCQWTQFTTLVSHVSIAKYIKLLCLLLDLPYQFLSNYIRFYSIMLDYVLSYQLKHQFTISTFKLLSRLLIYHIKFGASMLSLNLPQYILCCHISLIHQSAISTFELLCQLSICHISI